LSVTIFPFVPNYNMPPNALAVLHPFRFHAVGVDFGLRLAGCLDAEIPNGDSSDSKEF